MSHAAVEPFFRSILDAVRRSLGHALPTEDVEKLRKMVQTLQASDFGLRVPTSEQAQKLRGKPIRFQSIYEDGHCTIGIFILPPGSSIPLHNHPGMSVISHLLYGSMDINSYDLVPMTEYKELLDSGLDESILGVLRANGQYLSRKRNHAVVTELGTSLLLPHYCNLHEFTAGDALGCAVLDILAPCYSPETGRDCTYFNCIGDIVPATEAEGLEDLCILQPCLPPESFSVETIAYEGPRVPREETESNGYC